MGIESPVDGTNTLKMKYYFTLKLIKIIKRILFKRTLKGNCETNLKKKS